jgi:hypothetical protein
MCVSVYTSDTVFVSRSIHHLMCVSVYTVSQSILYRCLSVSVYTLSIHFTSSESARTCVTYTRTCARGCVWVRGRSVCVYTHGAYSKCICTQCVRAYLHVYTYICMCIHKYVRCMCIHKYVRRHSGLGDQPPKTQSLTPKPCTLTLTPKPETLDTPGAIGDYATYRKKLTKQGQ